jgi:hypothetical protein
MVQSNLTAQDQQVVVEVVVGVALLIDDQHALSLFFVFVGLLR